MPKQIECACGCGETFEPTRKDAKYVNRDHQLRAGRTVPRREYERLERELATARVLLDRYATVKPADMKVPTWLTPKRRKVKGDNRATPVLMLSDLHLDEVVDLYEMDGLNEYDRAIAERRLTRVIDATVELLKTYVAGVHYDGLVVPMLGDVITGVIHDELARTNAAPPPATIVHWVPILASALEYLAQEIGPVHVPCVDGNHDRTYGKTPTKQRATSSYAWIVYNWLADTLRDDDRITFGISTSPEQLVNVYGTRFLLSHGDGFRSAGGVGGLYPALLKWLLRAHQLYERKGGFDYALLGHWHQPLWGQDFVVNGSLKGYDQYAKDGKLSYNDPSQQLFIVTPERGITGRWEVFGEGTL